MGVRRIAFSTAAACALLIGGLGVAAASAAPDPGADSPQLKAKAGVSAAASPAADACRQYTRKSTVQWNWWLTYNVPQLPNMADGNWHTLLCGNKLSFRLAKGEHAVADANATAELDCTLYKEGVASKDSNGWCEGRFVLNGPGAMPFDPNNEGRGDTYAWDSTNGGAYDWSAHTLHQVAEATCDQDAGCAYTLELQVRGQNGANYLWLDDLTTELTVYKDKVGGPYDVRDVRP